MCVDIVCSKVTQSSRKEPWEDTELNEQFKNLRKCSKHKDIRVQQKEIKKRREELKNDYYQDHINSAAARDLEK